MAHATWSNVWKCLLGVSTLTYLPNSSYATETLKISANFNRLCLATAFSHVNSQTLKVVKSYEENSLENPHEKSIPQFPISHMTTDGPNATFHFGFQADIKLEK
jgi:hypothetical protein